MPLSAKLCFAGAVHARARPPRRGALHLAGLAGTRVTFGQFLVSSAKRLADFPEMGRMVPEFDDPSIREIIVRSYRVIWRLPRGRGPILARGARHSRGRRHMSWKRRWSRAEPPTSKSCAIIRPSNTSAGKTTGTRLTTAPSSPPPNSEPATTRSRKPVRSERGLLGRRLLVGCAR